MCKYKQDNSHMMVVDVPPHMKSYKENRVAVGLSDKICINGKKNISTK